MLLPGQLEEQKLSWNLFHLLNVVITLLRNFPDTLVDL